MSRVEEYRALLRQLDTDHWHAFLTERSGLPGPRGNIELGQAAAEEADPSTIDALIATNDEFLVFCGVIGLGRILAEGGHNDLGSVRERLRAHAGDERWRVREAVAMAVQRLGVAVAADPERGLPRFLALSASSDPDVRWVVRENGRKARLAKLLGATSQGC
ncbi:MAG: hypothetical protein IPL45_10910 [Actinomycetales bacterium]|nr:hypothetical protein [Actinomycetales bacterium]